MFVFLLICHRFWSCCQSLIDWLNPGSFPVALCLEVHLWGTRFHQDCLSWRQESCCWSGWEHKWHVPLSITSMWLTTWLCRPIRMNQRTSLTAAPSSLLLMETITKLWEPMSRWDEPMSCWPASRRTCTRWVRRVWWRHDGDDNHVVMVKMIFVLQVETYLTVAKCRLSPEANCTL